MPRIVIKQLSAVGHRLFDIKDPPAPKTDKLFEIIFMPLVPLGNPRSNPKAKSR